MRKVSSEGTRKRAALPYGSQELESIMSDVERDTNDPTLGQSIYFGPTALTHIRRLIETGGTIITDTTIVASDIDTKLLGRNGAKVVCFIDDAQVRALAEQRGVTRAEVAADYALAVPGPKLIVIGSAPAAIGRIIQRRQHEPMSDVCVLAASTGFASVVQMKERLMESNINCIVVRGKKGGVPATIAIVNAILREISRGTRTASFTF